METTMNEERVAFNRRRFFECLSALGLGSTLLPDALTIAAQDSETVTVEMIEVAQKIAGVSFTREEQQSIATRLNATRGYMAGFAFLRTANLGNNTQLAIVFNPVPPGKALPSGPRFLNRRQPVVSRPSTDEALAFLPVTHLAKLVETRQVTPSELTELYLSRLAQYDPALHCVVSLTPELARAQATQADAEIAAGTYRGPLHGIPFGLKDLFAVRGTKTTWGASPYKDQVIDTDATVYTRLRDAGAILVAKLSSGALALTAQWFGGVTRSPWNTKQDASGSSAGPGSATAAGLVAFSVGTDTGGSVIQPSARNGLTGMRPTFGRVSRYGAMALAWTQDTVGPMCRSAEDCALVFNAIYGPDGKDNTVLDVPFGWDATADVTTLRVGYLRSAFSGTPGGQPGGAASEQLATRRNNEEALRVIRSLGVQVVPFDLPDVAIEAIDFIRYAETAAAFDDLTRSGRLREVEHGPEQSPRPAEIRAGRFIPAVEYIQANRYRMRVMERMDEAMSGLDLFIGANLLLTNRTGHPVISLPNGFFEGSPTALQLTGKLFGEPELLLLAHAFQSRTDHHLKHPSL
jgi:Asp-tRNA(Asn)/Glu-tRNA(Gln) amidotransferase A subunit family amidase